MKCSPLLAVLVALISLSLPACETPPEEHHEEAHRIVVTNPAMKAVTLTLSYVCQIDSQRHIDVRALERGYLEEVTVKEGQQVKEGDVLFKVIPTIYQTKFDSEKAAAKLTELELQYTEKLSADKVVSENEVQLLKAKRDRAEAEADLAKAELNFATVKALSTASSTGCTTSTGAWSRRGRFSPPCLTTA